MLHYTYNMLRQEFSILCHREGNETNLNEIQSIINKGLDLKMTDCNGYTPLLEAVLAERKDIVKLLIRSGSDIRQSDNQDRTILHYVSWKGWEDIVQLLLDVGANVHAKDSDGDQPLYWAVCHNTSRALETILKAGGDCNWLNIKGKSPFYRLLEWNETDAIRLCVEFGAYVDSNDYEKLSHKSSFKDGFLKDINLCSQSVINRFNKKDLPALYEEVGDMLPPRDKLNINRGSGMALEVERAISFEIRTKSVCNLLEARPVVLEMLCVQSFLRHCTITKELVVASHSSSQKLFGSSKEQHYSCKESYIENL